MVTLRATGINIQMFCVLLAKCECRYVYLCVCVCVCVCMCVSMYVCLYVRMYACMYVRVCVHVCIYSMYLAMHVCTHVLCKYYVLCMSVYRNKCFFDIRN